MAAETTPEAGMRLVPTVPTEAMIVAGAGVIFDATAKAEEKPEGLYARLIPKRETASATYRAMLAAAPAPPAGGEGETMTRAEIEQWIEACNHKPAREVLRRYLALAARAQPPVVSVWMKLVPSETTAAENYVTAQPFEDGAFQFYRRPAEPAAPRGMEG